MFTNLNYNISNHRIPTLEELGFIRSSIKVKPFNIEDLDNYSTERNYPYLHSTSHLSPHLRFGTVSIRKIVLEAKKSKNLKLIFLCSPNNPSGGIIKTDLVEKLCLECPDSLIVVDEAYQEFSSGKSYIPAIKKYRNFFPKYTEFFAEKQSVFLCKIKLFC